MNKAERIQRSEAARSRRRTLREVMLEKLDRYYAKLHRLKKKRKKHYNKSVSVEDMNKVIQETAVKLHKEGEKHEP